MDGFVLAGGRSRRMGVDKARLPSVGGAGVARGWPAAVMIARTVEEVCERVWLVRRGQPDGLPWCGPDGVTVPVVREVDEGPAHPLWGVTTACRQGTTPTVLVVPCDLMGLHADALRRLIAALPVGGHDGPSSPLADATGAVIARIGGRVHPLLGVYPRALGVRAATLAARGAPARVFAEGATVVDLSDLALSDANTWADRGGVHPLVALQRRPGVGPAAVASEVARLRARGCLLPPVPPASGIE